MKNFSIRVALKTGWDNFVRRPWYLLGLALAILVLTFATTSESALFTALSFIVYGGYLGLLLKHYAWETVKFDDVIPVDNRWISFAILGIVKSLMIIAGFFLFVVPGVYLAIRWMFAELLVIDQGMRPLEALRASSVMTKGIMWKLFAFSLVAIALIAVGFLAFGIGAVVASIVIMFATIKIYKDILSA